MITEAIRKQLLYVSDEEYKKFICPLIPSVKADTVIGVRTPILRQMAKELSRNPDISEFLNALPHKYYEENNLHALILNEIKDFDKCTDELVRFVPYIDNWASCDSLRPKCLKKYPDRLIPHIKAWISSGRTYSVRFGIGLLMSFYLGDEFDIEYPTIVSQIESEEYYINMMSAWYFATALALRWDDVIAFITEHRLPKWVHNKSIQKAVESRRIKDIQKAYLKTLKR
jgi:3-methyladenine DNA glycosylase AlkD